MAEVARFGGVTGQVVLLVDAFGGVGLGRFRGSGFVWRGWWAGFETGNGQIGVVLVGFIWGQV